MNTLPSIANDAADPVPARAGRAVTPVLRPLLALSVTMALAQLAPLLLGLYMARLVAVHGTLLFSAYSLVNAANTTVFVAAASMLQSLYFVGGRAIGRGDTARYRAAIAAGAVLGLGLGIATAAASAAIGPVLALLGMDPALAGNARSLGLVAALAMLPLPLLVVFRVHAALNERAALVMVMSVAGALLTALLASQVRDSAPPLLAARHIVWYGVGVNWAMLALAALCCAAMPALRLPRDGRPPLAAAMREVVSVGWPIGAVVLLDSLAALVSSLIVSAYWLEWSALHLAVLLLVTVMLIGPLGIAQAAVQRVAVLHAQGLFGERNRVAVAALLLGGAYGLLMAVPAALWPTQAAGLLLAPDALAAAAPLVAPVMLLGAALLFLQTLIVIAAALLRGIGQTRAPLRQAFVGYMVVASGGQLLLGPWLGYGLHGVWYGLLAGFGATALAVLWRCRQEFRLPPSPASSQPNLEIRA